jgi:phosphoribosylanthranilate isomerase
MSRTRIKICGITRPEDATCAVELGVDFLGINFLGGPRQLSAPRAQPILDAVDMGSDFRVRFVSLVSVEGVSPEFQELRHRNSPKLSLFFQEYGWTEDRVQRDQKGAREYIEWRIENRGTLTRLLETVGLLPNPVLNLDTSVPVQDCPWTWLPVPVKDRASISELLGTLQRLFMNPGALVLDTAVPGHLGGTGQSFNWHWIAEARAAGELDGLPPIILAGGLNPDNVADAIRIARPWAVDVSSGVEVPGKPGIKDPFRMRDFIQAVRAADSEFADDAL